MDKRPFFSVIICTRNRPDIIKWCILALKNQSFEDFEVILSDNSDFEIKQKNRDFINHLSFAPLKYVTPDQVMNMHDHYNFALSHARGEYVGVLTDKNLLRRDALKDLYGFLRENPMDIINYNYGGCGWFPDNFFKWQIQKDPSFFCNDFEFYDPKQELLRRLSLETSRSRQGIYYTFGKIFFGFYHRSLIERIKKNYKHVFYGVSPDYTSATMALDLAEKAAFYHKKIMVAVNSYKGNGRLGPQNSAYGINFIKQGEDDFEGFCRNLPIPGVYTNINICAYDYLILNRLGGKSYQLDIKNLAQRVYEDLQTFPFANQEEKDLLWGKFNQFIRDQGINKASLSRPSEGKVSLPSYWERLLNLIFVKDNKIERVVNYIKYMTSIHYRSFFSVLK